MRRRQARRPSDPASVRRSPPIHRRTDAPASRAVRSSRGRARRAAACGTAATPPPWDGSPSRSCLAPTDTAFRAAAWAGVALSCLALTGVMQRLGASFAAALWAGMWVLYLSFVNVGQIFYGFGWETLLLEAGFLTIFAGGSASAPNALSIWMWRWLLFRIMFGAGLIKMRGDPCWTDLTCLDYYFETQPMPNPLSWYFHWMPAAVHHGGVVFNHLAELVVPFGYFAPRPVAATAGAITIAFQLALIVSG